jgi:hypothetical protein
MPIRDQQMKKNGVKPLLKRTSDVRVLSFPKSGRTWLSFMATWYIAAYLGLPPPGRIENDLVSSLVPERDETFVQSVIAAKAVGRWAPVLRFVHPPINTVGYYEPVVIDKTTAKHQILLLRDPRDVVVSFYHHIVDYGKGRVRSCDKTEYRLAPDTSVEEFLYSPTTGIRKIVAFMQAASDWADRKGAATIYYEDMVEDPVSSLRSFLGTCGATEINEGILRRAVEACSFDTMRAAERASFPRRRDRRRMRRGKSGGYLKELADREIEFVDRVLTQATCPALERYL